MSTKRRLRGRGSALDWVECDWENGSGSPSEMNAVATGGPGLVAVGHDTGVNDGRYSAHYLHAAVWTSPDGLSWIQTAHDAATLGDRGQEASMHSVTAGGPGVVAVGDCQGRAAAWVSPDGLTWSRAQVPHENTAIDRLSGTHMTSATAGGSGLVAVGYEHYRVTGQQVAAAWTSPDGLTWSRSQVNHGNSAYGGRGKSFVLAVTAGGPGLVAVGFEKGLTSGELVAAVWVSQDGSEFLRVPHDDASLGGPGKARLDAVVAAGAGLVAVGSEQCGSAPAVAAAWTSTDGLAWSRVPLPEIRPGKRDRYRPDSRLSAVTVGGPGIVAVGAAPGGHSAMTWVSDDGLHWELFEVPYLRVNEGKPVRYSLESVAAGGPGLVAVGSYVWNAHGYASVISASAADRLAR
jgi:hypothetical protein